jgi:hypothetical protein
VHTPSLLELHPSTTTTLIIIMSPAFRKAPKDRVHEEVDLEASLPSSMHLLERPRTISSASNPRPIPPSMLLVSTSLDQSGTPSPTMSASLKRTPLAIWHAYKAGQHTLKPQQQLQQPVERHASIHSLTNSTRTMYADRPAGYGVIKMDEEEVPIPISFESGSFPPRNSQLPHMADERSKSVGGSGSAAGGGGFTLERQRQQQQLQSNLQQRPEPARKLSANDLHGSLKRIFEIGRAIKRLEHGVADHVEVNAVDQKQQAQSTSQNDLNHRTDSQIVNEPEEILSETEDDEDDEDGLDSTTSDYVRSDIDTEEEEEEDDDERSSSSDLSYAAFQRAPVVAPVVESPLSTATPITATSLTHKNHIINHSSLTIPLSSTSSSSSFSTSRVSTDSRRIRKSVTLPLYSVPLASGDDAGDIGNLHFPLSTDDGQEDSMYAVKGPTPSKQRPLSEHGLISVTIVQPTDESDTSNTGNATGPTVQHIHPSSASFISPRIAPHMGGFGAGSNNSRPESLFTRHFRKSRSHPNMPNSTNNTSNENLLALPPSSDKGGENTSASSIRSNISRVSSSRKSRTRKSKSLEMTASILGVAEKDVEKVLAEEGISPWAAIKAVAAPSTASMSVSAHEEQKTASVHTISAAAAVSAGATIRSAVNAGEVARGIVDDRDKVDVWPSRESKMEKEGNEMMCRDPSAGYIGGRGGDGRENVASGLSTKKSRRISKQSSIAKSDKETLKNADDDDILVRLIVFFFFFFFLVGCFHTCLDMVD